MSIITGGLPYTDRLENEIYTDFRNMLRVDELFCSEDQRDTAYYALQLLYGDFEGVAGDAGALVGELEWFYSGGKEGKQGGSGKHEELVDFEQDANFIYADFLTAYGIDLTDEDTRLHWWQFLALLSALPEDASMSKRMYYRGVDLAEFKGKEKNRIARIKKEIAIRKKHRPTVAITAEEKAARYKERMQRRAAEAQGK